LIRRPISLFAALLLLASAAIAADPALPALFAKAKQEFQKSQYSQSLADFDELDKRSQQPGNEADRKQLDPVIAFYRAANLAALGRASEARSAFVTYLALMPKASLDPKSFPKPVIDAFVAARREVGSGVETGLSREYAEFQPASADAIPVDVHWAETPVRYLLTSDQKRDWAKLTTDAARRDFVDAFWKGLGSGNEGTALRRELERRMVFAEKKFGTDKRPGLLTDRALVFTLLGPPSYAASTPLRAGDEKVDAMRGGANNSPISAANPGLSGHTTGSSATGMDMITGSRPGDGLMTDLERGTREAWYYRRDRLSAAMRYSELRVDFISREGYGTGLMQRDPVTLQALGQASELILTTKTVK
jgi:GWxTD domain-containing protein